MRHLANHFRVRLRSSPQAGHGAGRTVTTIFAVLAALALAAPLAAQTTGTVTGVVKDPSGAVVAGAKITATHTETGATRSVTSDAEGRYVFAAMPVGLYTLRAELTGFQTLAKTGASLAVGETLVVDFALEVGPIEQQITVRATSPLLNTQSPELSYLVGKRAIEDLPLNGRNYTDLALLQPGVVAFPHRDGGSVVAHGLGTSINGQDPRSNVYLLDGTPQNDFTNSPAGSAAGTVLGMETIQEFRVEVNSYSAEFGRNSGGQINAVTRSGTNSFHGSLFHFLRNDNLDAKNYFDTPAKPEFKRNQTGATLGGPLRHDRAFFFGGYESLRERQGRTIQTFVPDNNARLGILPAHLGGSVAVNAAVQPYLSEFPVANGPLLLDSLNRPTGIAQYSFLFKQHTDQDYGQVRYDQNLTANTQYFLRYTYDGAEQRLPTDFPQFPRAFLSRNQFFTAELRQALSPATLHWARFGFSRTRIGQSVEANVPSALQPFVPGRTMMGDIDIGGLPRFGPQSSVNVQLVQNVFGTEYGWVHTAGAHLLKVGALMERYQMNMVNPTFSLGIYTFPSLRTFLLNQAQRFLGLTPNGALDRYWRLMLFGFYAQDAYRLHPRLTLNAGLRYEFSTMPKDIYGRDSALINLSDTAPALGQLYQNPTHKNISPRIGLAWDVLGNGKTSLRGGYGLYFNTNNQQNLIVTVTNPPATPRLSVANPPFPNAPTVLTGGSSIRPVEWNLKNPNVHVWNLTVQQQIWWDIVVTAGYAGARGMHLLRSSDRNIPAPQLLPNGTYFFPAGAPRPNAAFTTIELKSSDGNSWYNAMIFEVRKRWSHGISVQSSYTLARNIDTTQASTFFSDATNGTTSAFPEFPGLDYNKGLADFHAKHNWVMNFHWQVPFAQNLQGAAKKLLDGWQFAGITTMRSGGPLTLFIQRNWSRSQWSPSLGPGIGFDRPSMAAGRTAENAVLGRPDQWFDATAFVLPPAGTLGDTGRGAFVGPNLRTVDLALVKDTGVTAWGRETTIQFRAEAFNLFNRANFGVPSLLAFAGQSATEAPLPTLGRIRSTVTTSRQIQLGLRIAF